MSEALSYGNAFRFVKQTLGWGDKAIIRFLVFWRDEFWCLYCGKSKLQIPNIRLNLEHVIPESKGGEFSFDNLVTACAECNRGKSNFELPATVISLIKGLLHQNNERFGKLEGLNKQEMMKHLFGDELVPKYSNPGEGTTVSWRG